MALEIGMRAGPYDYEYEFYFTVAADEGPRAGSVNGRNSSTCPPVPRPPFKTH
jgi:hypothetical protein